MTRDVRQKHESSDTPDLRPPGKQSQESDRGGKHARFLLFLLGATAYVFISVGGRISVSEILCLGVLLFTLAQLASVGGILLQLVAAVLVMSLGLFISGVSLSGPLSETLAAISNYGLVLVLVVVLSRTIGRIGVARAAVPLFLGAAFGQVIGLIVTPSASSHIDPWKFGLGSATTLAVMVLLTIASRRSVSTGWILSAIVALAGLNIFLGSRSAAALIVLTGALFLIKPGMSRKKTFGISLAVIVIGLLAIVAAAYEGLAESGTLGVAAAEKLTNQSGDLGLLFGARKELVLLFVSWLGSPLIGWGGGALVDSSIRDSAFVWFQTHGYFISFSDYQRLFEVESVPLHSVALGGLVQAGLFAVPLLVVAGRLLAGGARAAIRDRSIIVISVVLTGLTHFATSPLGDTTRFPLAVALSIGVAYRMSERGDTQTEARSKSTDFVTR